MTAPTLKPCPFCGSWDVDTVWETTCFWVRCHGCRAHGPRCATNSEAVTDWNSAPRPPLSVSDEGRQRARVRIAVAVDEGGRWATSGTGYMSGVLLTHIPSRNVEATHEAQARQLLHVDRDPRRTHVVWMHGEVPLPPSPVEGRVEEGE